MDRDWLRRSLTAQIILAAYFQAFEWFPLGSLNDQTGAHNRPLLEQLQVGTATVGDVAFAIAFILPAALFLIGYVKKIRFLLWVGLISHLVWFILQLQGWWVAYVFGASADWQRVYHHVFGRTMKVLPSWGNHLAPDAMHLVIQLLLLAVIVPGVLGLVKRGGVDDDRFADE